MKAWSVTEKEEGLGVIVFAETRSKAKTLGRTSAGLDEADWVYISATRMPELDGLKEESCVLDWSENVRIYWNAKWYSDIDNMRCCDDCGRYWYEDIPESFIDESGICVDCQKVPQTTGERVNNEQ